MYAIYKQKKYDAELRLGKDVTLYSYVKEEGFENYVDPWGRESDDFFSKKMDIHELDYLYEVKYEFLYRGHYFKALSTMIRKLIDKDYFEIAAGIEKYDLIEKLGFKRLDESTWWKDIRRKDIEAIKIIEEPEGIFKEQGLKIKILEGKAIDDFLASVKD
jgi:hypothetical protein